MKRYAAKLKDAVVAEFDTSEEAFAWMVANAGTAADSLVDRERKHVNLYTRVPEPPKFAAANSSYIPDLEPLPSIHPRIAVGQRAQTDLGIILDDWRKRHGLTSTEYTCYLAHAVASFAGQLVSIERRPHPADEYRLVVDERFPGGTRWIWPGEAPETLAECRSPGRLKFTNAARPNWDHPQTEIVVEVRFGGVGDWMTDWVLKAAKPQEK